MMSLQFEQARQEKNSNEEQHPITLNKYNKSAHHTKHPMYLCSTGHNTMSGTVKIDGKANDMAKSISTIQVRNNLLAKNAEQSQVEKRVLYMCTSWVVNFTLRLQDWNHVIMFFFHFVWWRCLRHWQNFLRTYLELRIYFSYSKQETLFLLGCSICQGHFGVNQIHRKWKDSL